MATGVKGHFLFPALLLLLAISSATFAQSSQHKQVFATPGLLYLEFTSDSTLVTDLNGHWDTTEYMIRFDTLFIKNEYWSYGPTGERRVVNWIDFKLLYRRPDTIRMLNPFRWANKPDDWEDTACFVSINKLKEPIITFWFLKVTEYSHWTGKTVISIDSVGKLFYYREEHDENYPEKKATSKITRRTLSKDEFTIFKDDLSFAFLSKLPRYRAGCGAIDASHTAFEIAYNNKRLISVGCDVKWPHALLFERLYELANKNLLTK